LPQLPTLATLWSRLKRYGQAAVSLTYMSVFAGLPLADAAVEAAVRENDTHVESESTDYHSVAHDEYLCQCYRVLGLGSNRPSSTLEFAESAHHRDGVASIPTHRGSAAPQPLIPRAPPSF